MSAGPDCVTDPAILSQIEEIKNAGTAFCDPDFDPESIRYSAAAGKLITQNPGRSLSNCLSSSYVSCTPNTLTPRAGAGAHWVRPKEIGVHASGANARFIAHAARSNSYSAVSVELID